ncbi:MAG: hypothetical protein Q9186_004338 [Xanthomendoza sp. 1 TL-2023]
MPRKQIRTPPDKAVAFSPLFRLSPEVRNIIYTYVLVDSDSYHTLFIPAGFFKRRKNEPAYRCETCLKGLDQPCDFNRHHVREPCNPPTYRLPAISTTLLRCCRLVNAEAASLLYRVNTFHFNDPYTLHQFRWKTAMYGELSARVEEITLELTDSDARPKAIGLWEQYLSGSGSSLGLKSWALSEEFPHLKRLTIVLADRCLLYDNIRLRRLCDTFGQNLRGLDWVHIVGLNDENVVPLLRPMVCKSHSQNSRDGLDDLAFAELETVQTHATEYECASGWKNSEQNKRLLRMAEQQANHKPEDVALQQELGDLRMDILNRKTSDIPDPRPPANGMSNIPDSPRLRRVHAMLIHHFGSREKRLRAAKMEQEDKLRFLKVWARYASDPRFSLAQDINHSEGRVRELQIHIDNIQMRKRIDYYLRMFASKFGETAM